MATAREQSEHADGKGSVVLIEYVGGPRDGHYFHSARSLLLWGNKIWLRYETQYAAHAYVSRKAWTGQSTMTLYHRLAHRTIG